MNPKDIMHDAIHNFHPQYRDYTQYSAQTNDDRSPASTYGLNQHSTSALSSSTTPTPGDTSYHEGGTPSTPTGFPVQAPPLSNAQGQNIAGKLIPKLLTKKDNEKNMLLINDDI